MIGGGFQHAKTSTLWKKSKYFTWDYNLYTNHITVYVDYSIQLILKDMDKTKKKIGWMLESRAIVPGLYEYVLANYEILKDRCEMIVTHHSDLVKMDPSFFKWAPAYGTYIDNFVIREKTKLISMITSNKLITKNHIMRFNFANDNRDKIDIFGRGFREIDKKEEGLEEYAFSIAIENDSYDGYITEKVLDCFATATIPIYEGASDIINFFDSSAIIDFKKFNFNDITFEHYYSKKEGILNNLEIVKQFDILDDWIYSKYLVPYV